MMRRMWRTRQANVRVAVSRYAIVAVLMIHGWWASVAHAQRRAHPPEETSVLPQWACVVIFTGFVVAIAFKNPKRTHQS